MITFNKIDRNLETMEENDVCYTIDKIILKYTSLIDIIIKLLYNFEMKLLLINILEFNIIL